MKLSSKIFFSIFLTSLLSVTILLAVSDHIIAQSASDSFHSRYEGITNTLNSTLFQLENKAEQIMSASLLTLEERVKRSGTPTNTELQALATSLGVNQLYITNNKGSFIRSTKENPAALPNMFSFCERYKPTFENREQFIPTGIMPGFPSGEPYKFLFRASGNQKYIYEVGVHADYIGKTLKDVLVSDPNILSISMKAPNGQVLGTYGEVPKNLATPLAFDQKIPAQHEFCCSCQKRKLTDSNYFYRLNVTVNPTPMLASIRKIHMVAASGFFASILFCYFLAKLLTGKLVRRITEMDGVVSKIIKSGSLAERLNWDDDDEIGRLSQHFDQMLSSLDKKEQKMREMERNEAALEVASQVAHDIRSPLTALTVITEKTKELPEANRLLIKSAVSQIQDIANNLLTARKKTNGSDTSEGPEDDLLESSLISALTERIVSEKRSQFSDSQNFVIEFEIGDHGYGIFTNIKPLEYRRVLSNLINNSIESFSPRGHGKITVDLDSFRDRVLITVQDDGPGIPNEVLSRLGEKGVTYGKQNGNGLGIFHAKKTVQDWGGEFSIESMQGQGTRVTISLKKEAHPAWFLPALDLSDTKTLMVLDDDKAIHGMWDNLLRLHCNRGGLQLVHFTEIAAAAKWIRDNYNSDFRAIVDYELIGHKMTGLDLIETKGIESRAILVTSHFENTEIVERCLEMSVPLIPKNLVGKIPLLPRHGADPLIPSIKSYRENSETNHNVF